MPALKRINQLIREAQRTPFEGIGKPEPLKANLSGFWSRRIDDTNRLVYEADDLQISIVSCRYHYAWRQSRHPHDRSREPHRPIR
ncbi:Txe/YoeB family addiction module toxin [Burkholderia territorii]|uniref:Txe/YoeB family addiction module toxin n=2 Tax=Burkholderia territorii TaxID=1503055 RepID=UPI000B0A6C75|nr:Txe/YoeB family addiction module toxin [Burkholderia territorii]